MMAFLGYGLVVIGFALGGLVFLAASLSMS